MELRILDDDDLDDVVEGIIARFGWDGINDQWVAEIETDFADGSGSNSDSDSGFETYTISDLARLVENARLEQPDGIELTDLSWDEFETGGDGIMTTLTDDDDDDDDQAAGGVATEVPEVQADVSETATARRRSSRRRRPP